MNKDHLTKELLQEKFKLADIDISVEMLKSQSTHKFAHQYSVSKDTIIVAKEQIDGIGRLDRSFLSKKGGCYFSIVIPKSSDDNVLQYIPVISVAIATVIGEYGLSPTIKWPNDVLVNGKKICGILCSSHYDKTIISAGINVFNDLSDVSDIATSLYLEGVNDITRAEVIVAVLQSFYNFSKYDFEKINMMYQSYLNIKGKHITVNQRGNKLNGQVVGITKEGFLRLKTAHGETSVMYGDITVN